MVSPDNVKEEWQKPYIERVVQRHNGDFATELYVVGHYDEVYSGRAGAHKWDWVCKDRKSGAEAAVEAKRLTIQRREEVSSVTRRMVRRLCDRLKGRVPGTFSLFMPLIDEPSINLRGSKEAQLVNTIEALILESADSLEIGESVNLSVPLRSRLPNVLPHGCTIELTKQRSDGSWLVPGDVFTWLEDAQDLEGEDFASFGKVIGKANTQLGEARANGIARTFCILIGEGFMAPDIDALRAAITKIAPEQVTNIDHIYFVGSAVATRLGGSVTIN